MVDSLRCVPTETDACVQRLAWAATRSGATKAPTELTPLHAVPAGANMTPYGGAVTPRTRTEEAGERRSGSGVELRNRWPNPPGWVEWVDEPVPGYPKPPVPRDEDAAKALKKRTLTNLYNARPQWLADAHEALDAAGRRVRLVGGYLRRRGSAAVAGSERRRTMNGLRFGAVRGRLGWSSGFPRGVW